MADRYCDICGGDIELDCVTWVYEDRRCHVHRECADRLADKETRPSMIGALSHGAGSDGE